MSRDYDDDDDVNKYDRDDDRGEGENEEHDEAAVRAMQRLNLPSIFLIILSSLNIVLGGFCVFTGVQLLTMSPEQRQKQIELQKQINPSGEKNMKELGWSWEGMTQGSGIFYLVTGLLALLAAIITLIGAIRMRSLRGYGLAVFGAILACIPFVSICACCGVGEGIGIWALVVLLSRDVKSCFR